MSPEIVTSTGGLGLESRSFDRLYLNWGSGAVSDPDVLRDQIARAEEMLPGSGATRFVARFPLTSDAYTGAVQSPDLAGYLEGSIPLASWDGSVFGYLASFGMNDPSRVSPNDPEEMIRVTSRRSPFTKTPYGRMHTLTGEGFRFTDQVEGWMEPQVLDLWQPTFGWDPDQIGVLSMRLHGERSVPPHDRSVWMSALVSPSDVCAIAMAERLDIPWSEGVSIPLVESTEWRTGEAFGSNGFMAGTLAHLHEQVVRDLAESPVPPVIMAETNYASQAFRAGWAVGMEVPVRHVFGDIRNPPQILFQNVEVGDGLDPAGLRDFVLMHVPIPTMKLLYSHVL